MPNYLLHRILKVGAHIFEIHFTFASPLASPFVPHIFQPQEETRHISELISAVAQSAGLRACLAGGPNAWAATGCHQAVKFPDACPVRQVKLETP